MKIIVIGATGTIGSAVTTELSKHHEVIPVSHQKSKISVDITDKQSIENMYKTIGKIDAVWSQPAKFTLVHLLILHLSFIKLA